jgi:hypothetical protein
MIPPWRVRFRPDPGSYRLRAHGKIRRPGPQPPSGTTNRASSDLIAPLCQERLATRVA